MDDRNTWHGAQGMGAPSRNHRASAIEANKGAFSVIAFEFPYPPRSSGIYKITDSKSGRIYVGSAVDLSKRLRRHSVDLDNGNHVNAALQSIYKKDKSRLVFCVVEFVEKDALINREQFYIDLEISKSGRDRVLNVLLVAGSHLGKKRSEETKRRLSEAKIGKVHSEETKEKMRQAKTGRKLTEEHKKKIGDSTRGKKINRPKGIMAVWCRKYTDEQIREFREMKSSGMSYSEIEKLTCVSHGGLMKIINRTTYSDVE